MIRFLWGPDFVFSDEAYAQFVWSAYTNLNGCAVAIFIIYAFHFVNGPTIFIIQEPEVEVFIKGKLIRLLKFSSQNTTPIISGLLKVSKMHVSLQEVQKTLRKRPHNVPEHF